MPELIAGTVAQIIATLVIGIIAVVGSIHGAIRGESVRLGDSINATTIELILAFTVPLTSWREFQQHP
jgi:hypothetical protein